VIGSRGNPGVNPTDSRVEESLRSCRQLRQTEQRNDISEDNPQRGGDGKTREGIGDNRERGSGSVRRIWGGRVMHREVLQEGSRVMRHNPGIRAVVGKIHSGKSRGPRHTKPRGWCKGRGKWGVHRSRAHHQWGAPAG
jgi:hypothetical protein